MTKVRNFIEFVDENKSSKKMSIKESFDDVTKDAEVTLTLSDKNGGKVEVKIMEGIGMAGEDMIFAYIFHNGEISSREKIKSSLKNSDFKELSEYINNINSTNEASAILYTK